MSFVKLVEIPLEPTVLILFKRFQFLERSMFGWVLSCKIWITITEVHQRPSKAGLFV